MTESHSLKNLYTYFVYFIHFYVILINICFLKILPNKIFPALILNRKSCICYRKHCRSLFPQAHGMCGLKEIFEGAGDFFKKVPANPTFPFGKN